LAGFGGVIEVDEATECQTSSSLPLYSKLCSNSSAAIHSSRPSVRGGGMMTVMRRISLRPGLAASYRLPYGLG
jgi:hypothetical protein